MTILSVPFNSPEWSAVLEPLGLRTVVVRDITSISLWSFPSFRRELADPPPIPTRASSWFVGERQGIALVVRPMLLSPTALFVAVAAEIDPPLFAGARIYSRDLIPYFGAFPDARTPMMNPNFGRLFVMQAFDQERVDCVFGPDGEQRAETLKQALIDATPAFIVVVRDWFVEVLAANLDPNPTRLDAQLNVAASLARMIAFQAYAIPERQLEVAAREAWEGYAARIPLSFDRRRWRMWGTLYGANVDVALSGSPPSVITTFRVSFPQPLGCGLYVRPGIYSTMFTKELGIFKTRKARKPPGYKEIDKLLVIDAHDDARRRALFANVDMRKRLGAEAANANIVITDNGITLTRPSFASAVEIAARLESLVAIAHALSPPIARAGPFR